MEEGPPMLARSRWRRKMGRRERGALSSAPLDSYPARADRFAAGRFERFDFFRV
jgi:hypothetical protein